MEPSAQTEQLEDAIFLTSQAHRFVVDRNDANIQIDDEFAGLDHRSRVASASPTRTDTTDQRTDAA
jgi:hypothetical protein